MKAIYFATKNRSHTNRLFQDAVDKLIPTNASMALYASLILPRYQPTRRHRSFLWRQRTPHKNRNGSTAITGEVRAMDCGPKLTAPKFYVFDFRMSLLVQLIFFCFSFKKKKQCFCIRSSLGPSCCSSHLPIIELQHRSWQRDLNVTVLRFPGRRMAAHATTEHVPGRTQPLGIFL